MKKILIAVTLLLTILLFVILLTEKKPDDVNERQAITLLKTVFPEYEDYPSDSLPTKSIEAVSTPEGWRIGMYVGSSKGEGIIKANCFLITPSGEVQETGLFQGEGPARSINPVTCTPME